MKKRIMSMIALVAMALMLCMSSVSAASIKLSETKLTLSVGETRQITLKNNKKNLNKKVKWSSSNKKVATIKNGKITAKKKGKAVIKAKYGKKTYKCTVKVKASQTKESKQTIDDVIANLNREIEIAHEEMAKREYEYNVNLSKKEDELQRLMSELNEEKDKNKHLEQTVEELNHQINELTQ